MIMIPYGDGLSDDSKARVEAFNANAGTLYTIKETAVLLRVSIRTVQRWLADGTLQGFKLGGTRWRVPSASIAQVLHVDAGGGDGSDGQ